MDKTINSFDNLPARTIKKWQEFERFSQEEKSLARNVGGLGLGLSIAKENAELLGGAITVQSEKGKGSIFFVTIPYKPVNIKYKTSIDVTKTKKWFLWWIRNFILWKN